jgi:hypothetical protein
MDLKERIESLEKDKSKYRKLTETIDQDLDKLYNLFQPPMEWFYREMFSFIDIKLDTRRYNYILDRDGRSLPYSELREGLVADVSIKDGVYLSPMQIHILEQAIKDIHKPDYVNFIYEQ